MPVDYITGCSSKPTVGCTSTCDPMGTTTTPSGSLGGEGRKLAPPPLYRANITAPRFTPDILKDHQCKLAVTGMLNPLAQARLRATCTTVGHVVQSLASLERLPAFSTGGPFQPMTSTSSTDSMHALSSHVNALLLSDSDLSEAEINGGPNSANSPPPTEPTETPLSSDVLPPASAGCVKALLLYPSNGGCSLSDDLFRFTPVSLTSPNIQGLSLTVNIAAVAAKGREKAVTLHDNGDIAIHDDFCANLRCRSVNFEGTHRVVSIGNNMLKGSTAERISFGPMPALRCVGNDWMSGCQQLGRVDFACDFMTLSWVGDRWLRGSKRLSTFDVDCFPALQLVGASWLERCHTLSSLKLDALKSLRAVGDRWMSRCKSLTFVEISNLPHLASIGSECLMRCPCVHSVTLSNLRGLTTVGGYLLSECISLSTLSLMGTDNIHKIGEGWLHGTHNPMLSCTNKKQGEYYKRCFSVSTAALTAKNGSGKQTHPSSSELVSKATPP